MPLELLDDASRPTDGLNYRNAGATYVLTQCENDKFGKKVLHIKSGQNSARQSQDSIVTIDNRDASTAALITGTATSGGSKTLTDTSKDFGSLGVAADDFIEVTGGTGADQKRSIESASGSVVTVRISWATVPDATSTYKVVRSPFQASGLRIFLNGGTDKQLGIHGINDGCGDWAYIDVNGAAGTGIAIDPAAGATQAYAYQSQLKGQSQVGLKVYCASTAGSSRCLLIEADQGSSNRSAHFKGGTSLRAILIEAASRPGFEFLSPGQAAELYKYGRTLVYVSGTTDEWRASLGAEDAGATNPNGRLALRTDNAHDYLTITAAKTYQSAISFGNNTDGQDIVLYRPQNTRDFYIYTTALGTGALVVLQDGRVGIATTGPASGYKLDVAGNVRCVSLTQTSDERLKRDVRPIDDALARVRRLRGVTFAWNDRFHRITRSGVPSERRAGVVAQELEASLPEAVRTGAMRASCVHLGAATTPESPASCDGSCGRDDLLDAKGVDVAGIVALLVEAVKALDARVNA